MKRNRAMAKIGVTVAVVLLSLTGIFAAAVLASVDIEFQMAPVKWQRNGIYELSLILRNNEASAVNIAGVQADFVYDSAIFKEAPILVKDEITNFSFTVNTVNTLTEGLVYYSKGIKVTGNPNYFTLSGNTTRKLVTFRLRVENEAPLEVTNFKFQVEVAVEKRLGSGGTEAVLGVAKDSQITVVKDTTPPSTYVQPAGKTILQGNSRLVTFRETNTPNYGDLTKVYYTVGQHPVADPTTSSDWVVKNGKVELPANIDPEAITAVLKFFGEDFWGNREAGFHTETYLIDVVKPTLSNLSRMPDLANNGTPVTVKFSVSEPLQSASVQVNNNSFIPGGTHPNYTYTYIVQADDVEGNRPIQIKVTDQTGNQTVDTSLYLLIDMSAPSFTPVSFSPQTANAGDNLLIRFNASEELDTDLTAVTIAGYPAAFESRSGLSYIYSYPVRGDEDSSFVKVHGYDMAGNHTWNIDDWDLVQVSGDDHYGNPGIGSATVGIEWKRR